MLHQEDKRTPCRKQKFQALQPKKTQKFKQLKTLHQEDQSTTCRNQKSQALQPKKTQKLKQQKLFYREDQRTPNPQLQHRPSQPLAASDLKTENSCLDIVLAADETGEAFVGMQPLASLPPCPTTPCHLSIVPYKAPLSFRTRSPWKTMNMTLSNHRNRKKLATLSNHFNPIPFVRERPSDFATHQLLLAHLGLWNFLHLDFDRNIHSDLIKQFVAYYNPKKPVYRRSYVNGRQILVSRAALARALALPTKRSNIRANDAARVGPLIVSKEESEFVEKLVSGWFVLQDDSCELPDEVKKIKSLIRERRVEDVDWAGLVWLMVKSELLKGGKLVNCYYASHMQLLLKNQRPQLFENHVELVGFLDARAAVCDEENLENSWFALKGPEIVSRCIGVFSEESEKLRILGVEENGVCAEESVSEQKTETTLERCNKCRNSFFDQCMVGSTLYERMGTDDVTAVNGDECKGNKLQEPQTTVTPSPSPGNFEVELNANGKVSSVKLCSPDQQSVAQKEDGNNELKLLGADEETKLSTEDLFVGNSGELPNSLERKLNVNFECNKNEHQQDELTGLEFDSANDMLMNEQCNDEKLKMEYSSLNRLEPKSEGMNLISKHDNEEKEFGLDALLEDCKIIGEKFCTLDELDAVKMENGNNELKLLHNEDRIKLSKGLGRAEANAVKVKDGNKNVNLLHCEDESELPEGLAKEEIFESRTSDSLDSQEKEVNNVSDCKQMDYSQLQSSCLWNYGTCLESVSANSMLVSEESNEQRLKVACSSDLSMSRMHSLGRKDTNFHQMDLVLSEKKCEAEFGLNVFVKDHNVIDGKAFTSDKQCTIEMEPGSRKLSLQNELSECLVEAEPFYGKTSKLLESQENKIGNILISREQNDKKMEDGDREPRLVHGKYEKELSQGLLKEELYDARAGELHDNQEVEVGFIAEKSTVYSANQHTEIALEDEKPELLGIVKTESSVLNEILGAKVDLQNRNESKIEPFVESFAIQQVNLDHFPLDNSLKREIDYLNDTQFESLNETQKMTGFSSAGGQSFNLDLCSEKLELWVSRLKNAAQKCAQMNNGINAVLLEELETKNQIIEQSEKMRRQEQHKNQKHIRRLEREVYLLTNLLDEYRTALNHVDKSFTEYRKRAKLHEEPIYVDHPDGGGKVVLATELESMKLKKQEHENL